MKLADLVAFEVAFVDRGGALARQLAHTIKASQARRGSELTYANTWRIASLIGELEGVIAAVKKELPQYDG